MTDQSPMGAAMTEQVPSNETLSELFGYVINLSHDMDAYHSQKLMEVAGIIGGVIAARGKHAAEIECLLRERDEYRECAKSQADRAWQRLTHEPLPCPFCGRKAKVRRSSNSFTTWIVGCTSLPCNFRPEMQHTDRQYAIRKWNQRA